MKLLVILGVVLARLAWAGEEKSYPLLPQSEEKPAAIVAKVDGRTITNQALEGRLQQSRYTEEMVLYRLQRSQLQQMIRELLLQQEAKRRGLAKEALVAEVTGFAQITVSSEEVEDFYEENAEMFPEGKTEAMKKIPDLIRQEKAEPKLNGFIGALGEKGQVTIFLPPPAPPAEASIQALWELIPSQTYVRSPDPDRPGVVAAVNGAVITAAALAEKLQSLGRYREALRYHLKKELLEQMIGEALVEQEAEKRGISREELFESVTNASSVSISEEAIERAYQLLKNLGTSEDEQKLKEQIKQSLRRRRVSLQWQEFIESLKARVTITRYLEAPPLHAAPSPS
jgi:hypothetical protein